MHVFHVLLLSVLVDRDNMFFLTKLKGIWLYYHRMDIVII